MATSTNANHCSCYKTLCVEKRTRSGCARNRATTKYSTAKFNQPKQNMAAPMRRDKACENYEWNNVQKAESCMTQSHSTITIAMLMVGRWRY